MGLHVRTITPYALPGVLALLACWWFFSRKKDRRSAKQDHVSACGNEVETVDALQEILREEIHSSSRAQLDKEEEIVLKEDCTCSLPLGAKESFSYSMQAYCRVENNLVKESQVGILEEVADQEVNEMKSPDSFRANEVVAKVTLGVSTASVLNQSLDGNNVVKLNSVTLSDLEKECKIPAQPPCGCSQAGDIQKVSLKVNDPKISLIHDSELLEICSHTEAEKDWPVKDVTEIKAEVTESPLTQAKSVEKSLVSREVELHFSEPSEFMISIGHAQNPIQEVQQNNKIQDLESAKPCSQSEDVVIAQSDKTCAVFVKEEDVQPSVAEMLVENVVQFCQSIDDIGLAIKGDAKLSETLSSESFLSEQVTHGNPLDLTTQSHLKSQDYIFQGVETVTEEPSKSCEKSSITEVVREGNCTNFLGTFSKCLEKEEPENSCPIVDTLKEKNAKTFLGDYEAKIVEQLAINLISKVIVAARQEILSNSVSDVVDSCHSLDENKDVLARDTQSKQLVPESDEEAVSANLTLGLIDFDCTCESLQFEPSQDKNFGNTELTGNELCLEHQREEEHETFNASVCHMPAVSNFSPVHRRTDFFEESQPALEDSSLSVCTSEECINIDDPLQSTVLSTISIGYDSLSSSGIELSRETFNMSIEKPMKSTCGESQKEIYNNGDIKSGSPDLNNEGPLTAESEVDHSGGSDVNSMDSVDSGYALGNSEQFQNVKQKSDAKKADLVIWEFEVPKYLVGRLIGKQGRFVSFLKQSSGAKIYISTVPYTQDIQICHLEGSQQQIDRALSLIRKKFKDLNLTNIFAPPPPLIPLPVASWLTLPNNVSVEVVVVNVVNAGHMFVQQRTHPTFHALCGLDQHMSLCYAQSGIPSLPTPAEVGILCAAPVGPSVWWRAQVMAYFEETEEVEILYVDYGGYNRVKIDTLRQIRSDFVSLPFQGVEVLLDNVIPLGDEDQFSAEADAAVKELTRGAPMLTQVTNYDEATRLPLVQLWRLNPDEMVSVNRTLVERGFAEWIDSY